MPQSVLSCLGRYARSKVNRPICKGKTHSSKVTAVDQLHLGLRNA